MGCARPATRLPPAKLATYGSPGRDPVNLIRFGPAKIPSSGDTALGDRAGSGAPARPRQPRHAPPLDEPQHLAAPPRLRRVLRAQPETGARRDARRRADWQRD